MTRFWEWLKIRLGWEEEDDGLPLRQTGARVTPKPARKPVQRPVKPKPASRKPEPGPEFTAGVGGRIDDGGPGKNVLIRNKYVREDTGTHETLKIVDDSILESDDEAGIDPYNTGRFDRSKNWDFSRSKK